jgi:hypothetical protein
MFVALLFTLAVSAKIPERINLSYLVGLVEDGRKYAASVMEKLGDLMDSPLAASIRGFAGTLISMLTPSAQDEPRPESVFKTEEDKQVFLKRVAELLNGVPQETDSTSNPHREN